MEAYEKLGAFYLGREFDLEKNERRSEPLLYDSKDLTTHAVCVGMTGSGKTGLCLSLLEEAAIDGIPVIAIDPKGDIGNLCLTFPEMQADDFRPWIDESVAARKGLTPDQFAAETADLWTNGLADWGQTPERIKRLRDTVDIAIYTPGSSAGLGLTVLKSFAAPPEAVVADADIFREQVSAATSGLLALLGVDADPVQSREFILISNLLDRAWREGRDVDIPALIHEIQEPPFERVGIIDLDTFLPKKKRVELAMRLNNLLASPSFARWMEGDPLDVQRLLYTPEGKPRISVLSITHLSDEERMFFVTILLNEIVAWTRSQAGTSSLRALLYMDEVFGYFPPTANPPSKTPMLTLLKQARAFGLGVVLATQNPVDLDYKGLSNTGTWFLGRLQTERDKARVLEGLEGASAAAGAEFNRGKMEQTLAGLGKRVFLMNNVHEDQPVVFQTRWALSYLRGPMTRQHIIELMGPRRKQHDADVAAKQPAPVKIDPPPPIATTGADSATKKTIEESTATSTPGPDDIPESVPQAYLARTTLMPANSQLVYRPALLGRVKLHFTRSTYGVDFWQDRKYLLMLGTILGTQPWEEATMLENKVANAHQPITNAVYNGMVPELKSKRSFSKWKTSLKAFAYEDQPHCVWKCPELSAYSQGEESEGDFRVRLQQAMKEKRDLKVAKLRARYAKKLETLDKQIRTAEQRISKEKSEYTQSSVDTAVSFGTTLLGALFSRKKMSKTNLTQAGSSAKRATRAAQQRSDVQRAKGKLDDLLKRRRALDEEFGREVAELEESLSAANLVLEPMEVKPRKADIAAEEVVLVWTPWIVAPDGQATPGFSLTGESSFF